MSVLKNVMIAGLALLGAYYVNGAEETVNGAGATFPSPVYRAWSYNFSQSSGQKTLVNYQGLGSGAGINQIRSGTVDFGATDNPLTMEELKKDGLVQFPMLTGGVVVIVNVPGVKDNMLKLTPELLSEIYLGKITNWSDPAIAAVNPDLKLPKLKITVVRRSDSSGTTFIFTNYLSKISPTWKSTVGEGPAVKWPVGIGGQKNPGVCNNIAKIAGSIGYTEYTYAQEAKLASVLLKNSAGKFVKASLETFQASASNADWKNAPGYYIVLTEQPGEKSWPITGVTYILVKREQTDPAKTTAMFRYFDWCYTVGKADAEKLKYVPIPDSVIELVRQTWNAEVKVSGAPLNFKPAEKGHL